MLYGQYCFGSIAPDVDKASAALSQRDTHFFDRFGQRELMASHRSVTFLQRQPEFLNAPFAQLDPEAQAFALGYLCHLCVDEVSKHMWKRKTWMHFFDTGPGPAFAALDEVARSRIRDYEAIAAALDGIDVVDVIPIIPRADLETMLAGARRFTRAETTEGEFLALIDMFDRPSAADRRRMQDHFLSNIDTARKRAHRFNLDTLVKASLSRTRQRFNDLITGRIPQPGYPNLS